MAKVLKNLKTFFSDTRSRTIFLVTFTFLLVVVGASLYALYKNTAKSVASANVVRTPDGIKSIPGSQNPTQQYAELQEEQNIRQAEAAQRTGGSVIPTIVRSQKFADGETSATIYGNCDKNVIELALNQGGLLADITDACDCQQLKRVGFSAQELKDMDFDAAQLRDCGFTAKELKDAGFTAKELKDAGFTAKELKDAGFTAKELKDAGFSAQELKDAGFTAEELLAAGFTPEELLDAGFTMEELLAAGVTMDELCVLTDRNDVDCGDEAFANNTQDTFGPEEEVAAIPALTSSNATNAQLQQILAQQAAQMSDQRLQQQIQQRQAAMANQVNQLMGSWGPAPMQFYAEGNIDALNDAAADAAAGDAGEQIENAMIKAGDIIFAVLDTHVNSDEPGPVLATVVSGEFQGAKLIGSLDLPRDGQKVILSFNTLSIPDASQAISINAVAIDPDTARTALSDHTNNHYLLRYGSLFASSFLEGMGRAFATSGTRIDIRGEPVGGIITETNRTIPENLAVATGEFGRQWGNQVGDSFNRPATVQVFSGTGVGILFTQDVAPIS